MAQESSEAEPLEPVEEDDSEDEPADAEADDVSEGEDEYVEEYEFEPEDAAEALEAEEQAAEAEAEALEAEDQAAEAEVEAEAEVAATAAEESPVTPAPKELSPEEIDDLKAGLEQAFGRFKDQQNNKQD